MLICYLFGLLCEIGYERIECCAIKDIRAQ
jgi:hypothetical protein